LVVFPTFLCREFLLIKYLFINNIINKIAINLIMPILITLIIISISFSVGFLSAYIFLSKNKKNKIVFKQIDTYGFLMKEEMCYTSDN
jgi:formate hydrogenlyase subunit 3/multisubunit Na+/H+ antiporter MnhD subunit